MNNFHKSFNPPKTGIEKNKTVKTGITAKKKKRIPANSVIETETLATLVLSEINRNLRKRNPHPRFIDGFDNKALGKLILGKVKHFITVEQKAEFKLGTVDFTVCEREGNTMAGEGVRVFNLHCSLPQSFWKEVREALGNAPLEGKKIAERSERRQELKRRRARNDDDDSNPNE